MKHSLTMLGTPSTPVPDTPIMVDARNSCLALLLLALTVVPVAAMGADQAADQACAGVTLKCTEDEPYEKTIDGSIYSCYDCKQALCKDGGNGGLSGTATKSVCTEKATTFRPISLDDQSKGGDTLAPKPGANPLPGSDQRPRSSTREAKAAPESPPKQVPGDGDDGDAGQTRANPGEVGAEGFDEADAIFGTRTGVEPAQPGVTLKPAPTGPIPVPYPNTTTVVDHREPSTESRSRNEPIPARRGTLPAPSEVTISEVGRTSLRINWIDNAAMEYGVAVERGTPVDDRGGINYQWKLAFNVEERVMTRVQGTGWRTDEDDQLEPDTSYCYRLRAYRENHYSSYSHVACTRTSP